MHLIPVIEQTELVAIELDSERFRRGLLGMIASLYRCQQHGANQANKQLIPLSNFLRSPHLFSMGQVIDIRIKISQSVG